MVLHYLEQMSIDEVATVVVDGETRWKYGCIAPGDSWNNYWQALWSNRQP